MSSAPDLGRLWKSHIDKLASRAGSPKDLVSILSARGSQQSYAKTSGEVSTLVVAARVAAFMPMTLAALTRHNVQSHDPNIV